MLRRLVNEPQPRLGSISAGAFFLLFAAWPLRCTGVVGNELANTQLPLIQIPPVVLEPAAEQRLEFELAHVFHHGTHMYPGLHRKIDINSKQCSKIKSLDPEAPRIQSFPTYPAGVETMEIQRLVDSSYTRLDALQETGRRTGGSVILPDSDWMIDSIPGPNVTDKETVLSFARMAANAYVCEDGTWHDLGDSFNYTDDFGWMSDGLRGHIFVDKRHHVLVLSIKGTSPAMFDGEGTTTQDKLNDNLFFGCCCGQKVFSLTKQICDCMTEDYACNSTCLVKNLHAKDRYYSAAQELYRNVTERYEGYEVWLTGHSLGGAIASLLGMKFFKPVITFEAPGDALPAGRLGLPTPPGYNVGSNTLRTTSGAFHFGHNADPVFLGTCTTPWSTCVWAGYALESMCHTGKTCMYDTEADLGWMPYMGHHKIENSIYYVYEPLDLPKCETVTNCQDCPNWSFFKSNGTDKKTRTVTTKTSTVPSFTRTRTQTCKTPGWWGCLDETTTDPRTTSTSTSTTSTCKTPGWFGCNDPTTTTTTTTTSTTTTSSTSTSTSTSTCKTPGWFGCKDPTSAVPSTTAQISPSPTPGPTITSLPTSTLITKPVISTSCLHPGLFWGCKDKTTATRTIVTSTVTTTSSSCEHPGIFWGCWDPKTSTSTPLAWADQYRAWHDENDLRR